MLCIEDIKTKISDQSQINTITALNDQLVQKACKINELEESNRQYGHLLSEICNQNFSFLRLKTSSFMKSQDSLKAKYEKRLMEVEDRMGLEIEKCSEVIKARVAPLQEKIEKLRKSEQKLKQDETDFKLKQRELSGQVKLKDEQVQFYKKEAGRLNEEKRDLDQQLKDRLKEVNEITSKQKQVEE